MRAQYKICNDRNVEEAFQRFLEPGMDIDFVLSSTVEQKSRLLQITDFLHRLASRRRAAQIARKWAQPR
jgi:hypothetical protein